MVIAKYFSDPVVRVAISIALALLMGAAAWHKLRDRQGFSHILNGYVPALGSLLPGRLRIALALFLPWLELMAAVGLMLSIYFPLAAIPGMALLSLYTGVLAISVRSGAAIEDCGCHFGEKRQALEGGLVWRNAFLLLLTASLLLPISNRPLVWLDAITAGSLVLCFAILYGLANLLISNRISLREL